MISRMSGAPADAAAFTAGAIETRETSRQARVRFISGSTE
jgi:hypothetical protein